MKKFMNWLKVKCNQKNMTALSAFALCFATIAANVRCGYHYHQPKFPETAKQLRKK